MKLTLLIIVIDVIIMIFNFKEITCLSKGKIISDKLIQNGRDFKNVGFSDETLIMNDFYANIILDKMIIKKPGTIDKTNFAENKKDNEDYMNKNFKYAHNFTLPYHAEINNSKASESTKTTILDQRIKITYYNEIGLKQKNRSQCRKGKISLLGICINRFRMRKWLNILIQRCQYLLIILVLIFLSYILLLCYKKRRESRNSYLPVTRVSPIIIFQNDFNI
jgi:hypothetical protein